MTAWWFTVESDGVPVGFVQYQGSADLWHEEIYSFPKADSPLIGRYRCSNYPGTEKPHDVRWVTLHGGFLREGQHDKMLWCPKCRCLVTPPFDGYTYLDYPDDWVKGVG